MIKKIEEIRSISPKENLSIKSDKRQKKEILENDLNTKSMLAKLAENIKKSSEMTVMDSLNQKNQVIHNEKATADNTKHNEQSEQSEQSEQISDEERNSYVKLFSNILTQEQENEAFLARVQEEIKDMGLGSIV